MTPGQELNVTLSPSESRLISKIRCMSPEHAAEVESFVDLLTRQETDHRLTRAAARLSEGSFSKVWDNPDDAIYDQL